MTFFNGGLPHYQVRIYPDLVHCLSARRELFRVTLTMTQQRNGLSVNVRTIQLKMALASQHVLFKRQFGEDNAYAKSFPLSPRRIGLRWHLNVSNILPKQVFLSVDR